jgi:hypothetical protein
MRLSSEFALRVSATAVPFNSDEIRQSWHLGQLLVLSCGPIDVDRHLSAVSDSTHPRPIGQATQGPVP